MLLMPYDTTQGHLYQVDKIINQIKRAEIDLPLPEAVTPGGNTIKNLMFITPSDEHSDVNSFTQYVNLGTKEPKLVLDGRPFMRYDRRTGTYRLTAENDFMFQCIRGALTLQAMEHGSNVFRRLGDVPVITFVRWLTLALGQRFNLDAGTQIRMSVVVAFYYYGLMDDEIATSAEARIEMVNVISRITRVDVNTVLEISDSIKSLKTMDDLAKTLSEDIGTIRMGSLKYADIYTLVASSFMGINYRENAGVALEHLPTFIAMVYCAIADRSYRKATISRRAETAGRPQELRQFTDLVYRQVAEQFK